MSEMGYYFREWNAVKKARREANIAAFDPSGWTQHTEYHFSRIVAGKLLNYWPSRKCFQYAGKVMYGDVQEFIKAREKTK